MAAENDRFEDPIRELELQITQLQGYPSSRERDRQLERLQRKLSHLRREIFSRLTPWQKTLVARHPKRPYTLDFVRILFRDFQEIHGDRKFADDGALIAGLGTFRDHPVGVIGHQKGRDLKDKIARNFGMPRPEGYRKALRLMRLAEKFGRPVLAFIDTPGAYPGRGAEERGQAEAIAYNLREMARLRVPILVTVTGEGGSGGALAIGVGDRVNILENAIYSVISPEGCAAILWKDQGKAPEAARSLRLTAGDLRELGLIDEVIPEPEGGAHTNHEETAEILDGVLFRQMQELLPRAPAELVEERYRKYRKMGIFGQTRYF
ncbi:MAG: acetyl-CoA carboxylase carboxyltransferase subunit alpha [Acidobacteria bacterium]|nr:acetyl-CoA carboxylase carboxyltransferase subunit alpha [Acidobacteriota bacterium]